MKYALSLVCLSIFIASTSTQAYARSITSFRQSDAITALSEFMYDVGEDIPESTRLTDKKININELKNCTKVTSDEVLDDVVLAVRKVIRFYPDDEVPFEEALVDLENYLDYQAYKKCTFVKSKAQSLITSSYYVSSNNKIHLRLDKITLIAE